MPPRLFCYPDRPPHWALIHVMARIGGWKIVDRPEQADWKMLYRRATVFDLPPDDPYTVESLGWINGRSRDISKRRVHEVFAQVFGYPLGLEPATHRGPLVLKGDANYAKDARIVTGPLADLPAGQIAERVIDTRTAAGELEEYRVGVIAGRICYTHLQYRPDWIRTGAFINDYTHFRVVPPNEIFTAEEIARIEAFTLAFDLDFSGLDVLRDREDGRIYIIDANNTPSAPDRSMMELRRSCGQAHLDAFLAAWPPRLAPDRPAAPPPGRRGRATSGKRIPLQPTVSASADAVPPAAPAVAGGAATSLAAVAPAGAVMRTRPASIFFHPDQPTPWSLIAAVAKAGRWAIAERPEDADWRVLYRAETQITLAPDDPYAVESLGWINGRCRDISKRRVHRIFAETFGYPLGLDPTTHPGTMLLKSDANYVKDARVVTGPIAELPAGQIAERLIDTRGPTGETDEYRLGVVGGRIVHTYVHSRPDWISTGLLDQSSTGVRICAAEEILSAEEIARINAFSEAYGLDFGALDVLRDRFDGRIYIIDANNTPSIPSRLNNRQRIDCIDAHLQGLIAAWPSAMPLSYPPGVGRRGLQGRRNPGRRRRV